jgi:WKF domain
MDQSRVPAWKRLGLKLKYANETDTAPSTLAESTNVATNRVNGYPDLSPPSKKRCVEGKPNAALSVTSNGLTRTSSLKSSGSNVRKSVSFTPETKEDDGESSNFMQDKWDEEARNDQINDFLVREAEAAEAAANAAITTAPEESGPAIKLKKPKKEKTKKVSNAESGTHPALHPSKFTRKSKDALDYLQQYQNSRSTWKFNKNREVWLLKHLLSVQDVPSTYESALVDYLAGIKSENAKARLMDECHDCIVAEVESESDKSDRALMSKSLKMDTAQRRLQYCKEARERFKIALDSFANDATSQEAKEAQTRYERVNRATKLLESILSSETATGTDPEPEPSAGSSDSPHAPIGPVRKAVPKKRKNRTAVVEISSSEDTSSESSTSDSDM